MASRFPSSDLGPRLQTLQPRFHLRVAGIFILALVVLACFAFTGRGVHRAFFGGLAVLTAVALMVQYRRERAVVRSRVSAVGIVTDYSIPLSNAPKPIRFMLSMHAPRIPRVKYCFVAFDQKTYTGETGWNSAGLQKGSPITVLYNPENPAQNYPLSSLVFYTFR